MKIWIQLSEYNLLWDYELVVTIGMGQIMGHEVNQYVTELDNYLIYELRDNYVRLLKNQEIANHKDVVVRVLRHLITNRHRGYSFR